MKGESSCVVRYTSDLTLTAPVIKHTLGLCQALRPHKLVVLFIETSRCYLAMALPLLAIGLSTVNQLFADDKSAG